MDAPGTSDVRAYPTCKICDRGTLTPRKIRRLSGPAVAIGYILLIPSIIGIASYAILFIIALIAGFAGTAHGSGILAAVAGGFSLVILSVAILCFVSGLVGWLLIMKKHVLQCVCCGAVIDAVAPINSQSARNVILWVLFVFGITGAIWAYIVLEAGTQTSTPTATIATAADSVNPVPESSTTEPAQPAPDNTTAEATQPTPDNTTAEVAQPTPDKTTAEAAQANTIQPFTSADGRFSVLFPGAPTQFSQPVHWKNGETGTRYDIGVITDNAVYIVGYTDSAPDVVAEGAQAHLQGTESGFIAGKTLLSDQAIDLDGVPGRAYTAADSEYYYIVHDFVAGTRFYRLFVRTRKGPTATQAVLFMNSFRIQ